MSLTEAVDSPIAAFNRRRTPPAVIFEVLGRHYDDVIVLFAFNREAVDVIRALPAWARRFDRAARVWFIHPAFIEALGAELRRGGRIIVWRYGRTGVVV